ncbi:MAG TPA: hypothetical protein DCP38_01515, partial [Acidobacteria bacterium]|nr:hypothetical protein [Acidobacteriota bacterium]
WFENGRPVLEPAVIEHDQIGLLADPDVATIGQADDLRRQARGRTDRERQRDEAARLHVVRELPGVGPEVARMLTRPGLQRHAAVGAGRRVLLPHVVLDVERVARHRPEQHAGSERLVARRLGEVDELLDCRPAICRGHLAECRADQARVVRRENDDVPVGAALQIEHELDITDEQRPVLVIVEIEPEIVQAQQARCPPERRVVAAASIRARRREGPWRNDAGCAAAERLVRVLVEVDLDAVGPGPFDHEYVDRRVPPGRRPLRLDMATDDPDAGGASDLDRLAHPLRARQAPSLDDARRLPARQR